jgi:phosphate:Na+ symporter
LAQEIFRLEVFYFLKRVLAYHAAEFRLSGSELRLEDMFTEKEWKKDNEADDLSARYREIKKAQGEMIEYYVRMQERLPGTAQPSDASRLMRSVQSAMHAAKGMKDIHHNTNELLQSGNDLKFGQFSMFSKVVQRNLSALAGLLSDGKPEDAADRLQALLEGNEADYRDLLQRIYAEAGKDALHEKDISTLQNMNREIYSANKAMIHAVGDLLLDSPASSRLADLPAGIR